jgi:hypothetical protein
MKEGWDSRLLSAVVLSADPKIGAGLGLKIELYEYWWFFSTSNSFSRGVSKYNQDANHLAYYRVRRMSFLPRP